MPPSEPLSVTHLASFLEALGVQVGGRGGQQLYDDPLVMWSFSEAGPGSGAFWRAVRTLPRSGPIEGRLLAALAPPIPEARALPLRRRTLAGAPQPSSRLDGGPSRRGSLRRHA